ncbi:MAG: methionyl-tRNA formyltransferase [Candidatus Sungbacteria bacterium]|uniref:Methionyl-tRNA formyltransferase n=1 Tax=Candidatus Sungiibacteriota bacterium TaxID=2750080 RepID=A0A933DU74_9BACT|nr:methionyl-tRNA formyltransferase [Candidatus Sungbacteria bacterium]
MRIAFFGTSEFAVPILEAMAQGPWRPVLVITTPDAPAGRGRILKPPPAKDTADRLGIPVIQPGTLSPIPPAFSAELFDFFIVAAYGKILPPGLLKIPKSGSLNVHPSLLPRWRGPSPIQYAILNGDTETGVTVMVMDEKVDHGPILKSSKVKVQSSKVTTPELTRKLSKLGADLLLETIPDWLAGRIRPVAQDESQATYSKILRKEDGHIDWLKSAQEIEREVRAFTPWPGAYAFWQRGVNRLRLAVEGAEAKSQRVKDKGQRAGAVFEDNRALGVETGDGVLVIERLRPAGRKPMSGEDFLRGYPDIVGSVLG